MSSEWALIKLNELCLKITDGAHQSPKSVAVGKPMASVKDLTRFGVDISTARHISEDDFYALVRQGCQPEVGDVLIAKDGNSALDTVCVVDSGLDAVLLSSVAILRPDQSKINSHYLKHYLSSPDVIDYLKSNFISGAAIPRVVLKDFKKAEIRVPPLSEQGAIASVLDAFDNRITLLCETNATLEAIAQALFKSWFVDFDPVRAKAEGRQPEGMDAATAALFPDSFEESELGLVPKGWVVKALADAYEINPTRKLKKGDPARYLDMASVATQGHVVDGVVDREMGSGTKFTNGDTLLARITPCLENGKTAYVDFLDSDQVGWGSTEFVVLRPKAPLPSYHGYLLARHTAFRDYAIQSMSGTSGRQRIQNDLLGRYPVAVPAPEVAEAFAGFVQSAQRKIAANQSQAQTLTHLRDTLLPRLISGQLRLPDTAKSETPYVD
ncbi:restriction endonuclease subunit S [Marinobacter sp.]|uniref:restriction endonuclease subunit S n=1 Tax=Marinobacter sp. TaxID=50741 RepID=UPI003A922A54